jgi:hypothetical protein
MRRFLVPLLLVPSLTAVAKDPPPFDPAGDPAQQAATFLKGSKLEALNGAKRVAISQFRVEFMVENKGSASSSSTAGWTSSRSDIKLIGVSDELRQSIADQLCDRLVQELTAAGVEVVPHETLSADENYKSMEKILRRTQEPLGMQAGKSVFVGAHGTPYYLTNDDKHVNLATALGGFSTVQPQNIEPRIAESLQATVLRVTMSVKFADTKSSGGMFHMGSSVETGEALAWVPDQTQFLFVTPDNGKARVTLAKTILMPNDALTMKDITTKGEKATQLAANIVTGLFAGGGRTERHYEATANPEAYQAAISTYGAALESALIAMVRPAMAGTASD